MFIVCHTTLNKVVFYPILFYFILTSHASHLALTHYTHVTWAANPHAWTVGGKKHHIYKRHGVSNHGQLDSFFMLTIQKTSHLCINDPLRSESNDENSPDSGSVMQKAAFPCHNVRVVSEGDAETVRDQPASPMLPRGSIGLIEY